jgi:hypothetical protein
MQRAASQGGAFALGPEAQNVVGDGGGGERRNLGMIVRRRDLDNIGADDVQPG